MKTSIQIDELLKEIKIDYTKMTALELVLHRMKALFDQSADVTEATVSVFSSIVAYNWNRC